MKKLLVGLATALLLFACDTATPNGGTIAPTETATTSQPIVNGTRDPLAVDLTAEEIRAIGWLFPAGDEATAFCTGTIVAPDLVVTASHCVNGAAPDEIGFGVGLEPSAAEATFTVSAVYINRMADAAFIVLGEDATQADVAITPIPINLAPIEASAVGRAVQAGGHGDTFDDAVVGRWFATVYIAEVAEGEIVVDGRGVQGICQGDSGSGLIDVDDNGDPIVLAVESWGDASCVDVDHMTRLDTLSDWIGPILEGEVPVDPCEGIGSAGACEGDVAVSCRRGGYSQTDCAALGTTCSYISGAGRFGCSCGDLPAIGWCDGDYVEFCREGRVIQFSCAQLGGVCGYSAGDGQYFCVEAGSACRAEDAPGRCEGGTAINCVDGDTTREICSVDSRVCEKTEAGAVCVDAEPDPDTDMGGMDSDAGADNDAGLDVGFPEVGADNDAGNQQNSSNAPDEGCAVAGTSYPNPWVFVLGLVGLAVVRRRT